MSITREIPAIGATGQYTPAYAPLRQLQFDRLSFMINLNFLNMMTVFMIADSRVNDSTLRSYT